MLLRFFFRQFPATVCPLQTAFVAVKDRRRSTDLVDHLGRLDRIAFHISIF